MNKQGFIEELKKQTGLDEGQCIIINSVIEDTSLIGTKNKEKMILGFVKNLNVSEEKAEEIYNIAMGIIGDQIKNKLKNPFKN